MSDPIKPEGSTTLTAEPPVVTPPADKIYPPPVVPPPVTPPVVPPAEEPPVVPPVVPPTTLEPDPKTPPADKKPDDKTPATPPADYDLKLPEGSLLSAEDVADTLKTAKAAGLNKEQAEALLNSKDRGAQAFKTRGEAAFEAEKVKWKKTIAEDPEMGGDKQAETAILSARAFKSLASVELQLWAEKTGLGDYPEFVRLMAKVGRMMAEDKLVTGSTGAAKETKSAAEKLYGKTTPGADGKVSA